MFPLKIFGAICLGSLVGVLHAEGMQTGHGWGLSLAMWVFLYVLPLGLFATPFARFRETALISLAACVSHMLVVFLWLGPVAYQSGWVFAGGLLLGLSFVWAIGVGWMRVAGRLRQRVLPLPGRCRKCGYSLFGLTSFRCPECGTPFALKGDTEPISDIGASS